MPVEIKGKITTEYLFIKNQQSVNSSANVGKNNKLFTVFATIAQCVCRGRIESSPSRRGIILIRDRHVPDGDRNQAPVVRGEYFTKELASNMLM